MAIKRRERNHAGTGWQSLPQDRGEQPAAVAPDLSQTWGFGHTGEYTEDSRSQVFHIGKGVINIEKGKTGTEDVCVNSQV